MEEYAIPAKHVLAYVYLKVSDLAKFRLIFIAVSLLVSKIDAIRWRSGCLCICGRLPPSY